MLGNRSFARASRIHMAVWGSTGPTERYSAIPSMNQSGNRSAVGMVASLSAFP